MEDIPAPQVLDPNRVSHDDREEMTLDDHRSQSQLLAAALDESCGYAQQLWGDLAAARRYLHDSLPPERGQDDAGCGVSPTGPEDADGWARWVDAFAEITSVLSGPRGDNGFGRSSATLLARSRREAAVPVVRHRAPEPDQPQATKDAGTDVQPDTAEAQWRTVLQPLVYGATGAAVTVMALGLPRFTRRQGD